MCLGRSKPQVTPFFLLSLFYLSLHLSTAGSQQLPRSPILPFSLFPPSNRPLLHPSSRLLSSSPPFPFFYIPAKLGSFLAAVCHCKGAHIKGGCTAVAEQHHGCPKDNPQRGALAAPPRSCWLALAKCGNDFCDSMDREPSRAPFGHFRRAKTC